jgi:hypothetical protein
MACYTRTASPGSSDQLIIKKHLCNAVLGKQQRLSIAVRPVDVEENSLTRTSLPIVQATNNSLTHWASCFLAIGWRQHPSAILSFLNVALTALTALKVIAIHQGCLPSNLLTLSKD